jgi:hypothetical protein
MAVAVRYRVALYWLPDSHSEQPMLRLTIALLVAIAVCETAAGAGKSAPRHGSHHGWHRAATMLPAGLPRRHYDFRTTISDPRPSAYVRPWFGACVPYWDRLPDAC